MARFTRVFGVPKLRVNFVRGLRFRLAVSYVFFFAILLGAIGYVFRQRLMHEVEKDVQTTVKSDWDAAKLYLRISNEEPVWIYDFTEPGEAFIVERLRRIYLLTDSSGNVLQSSEIYNSIGPDRSEEITRILSLPDGEIHIRWDRDKARTPYMIKAGSMLDEHKEQYFLAIGRSLAPAYRTVAEFEQTYLITAPGLLVLAS